MRPVGDGTVLVQCAVEQRGGGGKRHGLHCHALISALFPLWLGIAPLRWRVCVRHCGSA
jgi:hypothetical protein